MRNTDKYLRYFYCENCFKTHTRDMTKFKKAAEELEGFRWSKSGMFSSLKGSICPYCKCYESTFDIDFYMIPIVQELHNKGYKPLSSCSGHHDPDCFDSASTQAYVLVKNSKAFRSFLFTNKKSFTIERDVELIIDNRSSLGTIIRAKYKDGYYRNDMAHLCDAILNVVKSVPENPGTNGNRRFKKYTYIDKNGIPYMDKEEE